MPKYRNDDIAINDNELYKNILEKRGLRKIEQYKTKTFLGYVDSELTSYSTHTWSMGDRYYKLSYQHYGVYQYWWVIALFNNKPTEGHLEYGDVIKIPDNPEFLIAGV